MLLNDLVKFDCTKAVCVEKPFPQSWLTQEQFYAGLGVVQVGGWVGLGMVQVRGVGMCVCRWVWGRWWCGLRVVQMGGEGRGVFWQDGAGLRGGRVEGGQGWGGRMQ